MRGERNARKSAVDRLNQTGKPQYRSAGKNPDWVDPREVAGNSRYDGNRPRRPAVIRGGRDYGRARRGQTDGHGDKAAADRTMPHLAPEALRRAADEVGGDAGRPAHRQHGD